MIESKECRLKRPYIIRLWRMIFCNHPFSQNHKIGTIHEPKRNEEKGYIFVVHVRRCRKCRKYFLDSGFEEN